MFFVVLRDMILYLHKDEHEMKKKGFVEGSHNVILIHHGLAVKATDYSKKQHVFRLQTADWAQYLFQTSNSKELQEWIDTVNFVAASLSAPPLPGAVGSQKKFQRPLLPVSYTRFNLVSLLCSAINSLEVGCRRQDSHKLWKSWKTWKITKKNFHAWKNHGILKNLINH